MSPNLSKLQISKPKSGAPAFIDEYLLTKQLQRWSNYLNVFTSVKIEFLQVSKNANL